MRKVKKLFYDIEITGILGWTYQMYDSRVHKVEKMPIMMCFSYAWNDGKIQHESIQYQSEEELTKKLWQLFDEADIVVAFNAYKFDNKVAVAKFMQFGLMPPARYKTVDPFRVHKAIARTPSNSLQALCEFYGIEGKTEVTHSSLWYGCLQGDEKSWKLMKKYNNGDIRALRGVYNKQLPWNPNHPNMGVLMQKRDVCAKCGSPNIQSRGTEERVNGLVRRWSCNDCGGNSYDRVVLEKTPMDERPNLVN